MFVKSSVRMAVNLPLSLANIFYAQQKLVMCITVLIYKQIHDEKFKNHFIHFYAWHFDAGN